LRRAGPLQYCAAAPPDHPVRRPGRATGAAVARVASMAGATARAKRAVSLSK
jgi:hypothetical protein